MRVLSNHEEIKAFEDLLSKGDAQALAEIKTQIGLLDTEKGQIVLVGSGGIAGNDDKRAIAEFHSIMPDVKVNKVYVETSEAMNAPLEPTANNDQSPSGVVAATDKMESSLEKEANIDIDLEKDEMSARIEKNMMDKMSRYDEIVEEEGFDDIKILSKLVSAVQGYHEDYWDAINRYAIAKNKNLDQEAREKILKTKPPTNDWVVQKTAELKDKSSKQESLSISDILKL